MNKISCMPPFFHLISGILVELKGLLTKERNRNEEVSMNQLKNDFNNTLPFKSHKDIRSMSDVTKYLNVIQVSDYRSL